MGAGHDHGAALIDRESADESVIVHVRRILWIALVLNAAMFIVEAGAGLAARSVALQADALDFLSDTATYAISLAVILAALGVFGTATVWPDLAVAGVMATLAFTASISILRQAAGEWRASR